MQDPDPKCRHFGSRPFLLSIQDISINEVLFFAKSLIKNQIRLFQLYPTFSYFYTFLDFETFRLNSPNWNPTSQNDVQYEHTVSEMWIEECLFRNPPHGQIVDMEYFYKPVKILAQKPMKGVVASVFGHCGPELNYLAHLITAMGGVYRPNLTKNTSTHLIACEKESEMVKSAIKWQRLKIVTSRWVTASYNSEKILSEDIFPLPTLEVILKC